MDRVTMVVEVPFGSNLKYEQEGGHLRLDRVLNTCMMYPGNYGYIPGTLAGDGDPLDAIMLVDYAVHPSVHVDVRIIGVLITEDEKGMDEKLIVVPCEDVDARYASTQCLEDVSESVKSRLSHFFSTYKTLDTHKWVKVQGFGDVVQAHQILRDSIQRLARESAVE